MGGGYGSVTSSGRMLADTKKAERKLGCKNHRKNGNTGRKLAEMEKQKALPEDDDAKKVAAYKKEKLNGNSTEEIDALDKDLSKGVPEKKAKRYPADYEDDAELAEKEAKIPLEKSDAKKSGKVAQEWTAEMPGYFAGEKANYKRKIPIEEQKRAD